MKSPPIPHPPLNLSSMLTVAAERVEAVGGPTIAATHYGVQRSSLWRALRGDTRYHKLLERIVSDALGRQIERYDMWR